MWRTTTTLIIAALVATSAGAQLAPCTGSPLDPERGFPFGFFDGNPEGKTTASGLFSLFGWALAEDGVVSADLVVDGVTIRRFDYGRNRPDVERLFPGFPNSSAPGFGMLFDTTQFLNGNHTLNVKVMSTTGTERLLNPIVFDFQNNTHSLRPFGDIDFPQQNAQLFGNCDLTDPRRRYSVFTGWVLDAGVEVNDHGVAFVELLLNGGLVRNSRISCHHSEDTGAFSDCYGLRRLDIERRFPTLKDAPNAGFRFVLDVGALIAPVSQGGVGYTPGNNIITVRSGDVDSQIANVASINVSLFCDDFVDNEGSFGQISFPLNDVHSGLIEVNGWALDREGISKVFIFVDGTFIRAATRNIPRPDITDLYPGFPNSKAPGWAVGLNTIQFSDGEHELNVVVRDRLDVDTLIGEVRFTVNNSSP